MRKTSQNDTSLDVKSLKINDILHKKLKHEAIELGVTLQTLLEEIILNHYGTDKIQKHKDKTKQASQ